MYTKKDLKKAYNAGHSFGVWDRSNDITLNSPKTFKKFLCSIRTNKLTK